MQKNEDSSSPEFFKGKYEHENVLTRPILGNFFRTIRGLIPNDAKHVLEVGCGPGFSSQRLKKTLPGRAYEASELEPSLVEFAQKLNPDIPIAIESVYDLKHSEGSVDLVICLEVMEHLEDPEKALAEIARVTSRYAIISVPNEPLWRTLNVLRGKYLREWGNTPGHINHWSTKKFVSLIDKYFEATKVRRPLPWSVVLARKKV